MRNGGSLKRHLELQSAGQHCLWQLASTSYPTCCRLSSDDCSCQCRHSMAPTSLKNTSPCEASPPCCNCRCAERTTAGPGGGWGVRSPGGPGVSADRGVQVAPPAAHALLVCAPVQTASDVCPRIAMLRHKCHQRLVLLLRPLLLLDVWVHLRAYKVNASRTSSPRHRRAITPCQALLLRLPARSVSSSPDQ